MHPLAKYAVPTGITLIVFAILWWVLTPIIKAVAPFWPLLIIGVAIGLFIWRIGFEQLQKLIENPIAKGLAIAFLLTCIYALFLTFIFQTAIPWTQKQLGTEPRLTILIIIILGAIAIPVFWYLFAASGIPGDPKIIGKGFKTLALISLVFIAWWNYQIPNQFFSHKNGESKFWVADSENKVYFSDGFSPVTGEKLRPGIPKDAEKFKQASWISQLKSKIYKPAPPTLQILTSTEERFYIAPPNKWSERINIPDNYWYRVVDPENKIVIKSWNGKIYAPTERVWEGDKILNANYWIKSVTGKEEVIKILLRPK